MKKIVALVTMLVVLTACGGGGGRPSSDDIAKALKDKDNSFGAQFSTVAANAGDDVIDCIAKALHDSDVSDDLLQALVDDDAKYKANSDDEKALTDAIADIGKCVTA